MRNHDGGLAPQKAVDALLHLALRLRVQGRGGLVQHQDGRPAKDRARDGDTLSLPARQRGPALPDHGVVPVGQCRDELVRVGSPGRLANRLLVVILAAVRDVLVHGSPKNDGLLCDHADLLAHMAHVKARQVPAVEENASALRLHQTQDQVHEGGLARTRRPHQRHCGRALEQNGKAGEDRRPTPVREIHGLKLDLSVNGGWFLFPLIALLFRSVEHLVDRVDRFGELGDDGKLVDDVGDRVGKLGDVGEKQHQRSDEHLAAHHQGRAHGDNQHGEHLREGHSDDAERGDGLADGLLSLDDVDAALIDTSSFKFLLAVQFAEKRGLDELAQGMAQILVGHARRALQPAETHVEIPVHQQVEGDAQKVEEQHLPVVRCQHRHRKHDGDDRGQQRIEEHLGETLGALDIDQQLRDEAPALVAGVILQRQKLQLLHDLIAQAARHPLGDDGFAHGVGAMAEVVEHPQQGDHHQGAEDQVQPARRNEAVDDELDENGIEEIGGVLDGKEHRDLGQGTPVHGDAPQVTSHGARDGLLGGPHEDAAIVYQPRRGCARLSCPRAIRQPSVLSIAISEVFANRKTILQRPVAFTSAFYGTKETQQRSITLSAMGKEQINFEEIIEELSRYFDRFLKT